MSDEFSTHRLAIADALKSVGEAVKELRSELTKLMRESDIGSTRTSTRLDALEKQCADMERRLRVMEEAQARLAGSTPSEPRVRELEQAGARVGAFGVIAQLVLVGVVSLVVTIIGRLVVR